MLRMLTRPPAHSVPQDAASECLMELRTFVLQNPHTLTPLTRQQLLGNVQLTGQKASRTFFFSASDLWQSFVSTGTSTVIEICQRCAYIAWLLSTDRDHARNALILWAIGRAVDIIPIADLQNVIDEVTEICALEGTQVDFLRLSTLIMESHVGLIRSNSLSSDSEATDLLLKRNQSRLRALHNEYRKRTVNVGESRTAKEHDAWTFLLAAFPIQETSENAALRNSILSLPEISAAIQEGDHNGVYSYIDNHYDAIKQQLQARLAVTFAPTESLWPDGKVFTPHPQRRDQVHPMFARAIEHMEKRQLESAETMLGRLSREIDGKARDICKNFQAYALGNLGELADARGLLKNLIDNGFERPSAYWNYVCFTPNDQTDLQMRALASGMQNSAHPLLLKGILYLSLILDEREPLRRWLPLLTYSEALLLSYYFDFEGLGSDGRESAIVRLNLYRRKGEPVVPDPLAEGLPGVATNDLMSEMVERHQPAAFEFWLKCRPYHVSRTLNHLALVSDYYYRTNQQGESLTAFMRELKVRISRLERPNQGRHLFIETSKRAEQWLLFSMTPTFRESGSDIYRLLKIFDMRSPRPPFRITPTNAKIRDYFDREGEISETLPYVSRTQAREFNPHRTPSRSGGVAHDNRVTTGTAPIEATIARIGTDIYTNLRDVRGLPHFRATLDRLATELANNHCPASAETTRRLVAAWDRCLHADSTSAKEVAYGEATQAFAEIDSTFKREFDTTTLTASRQMQEGIKNVNRSIARLLELMPEIRLSPADGDHFVLASGSKALSSAIVVSTNQDEPVRILDVQAHLLHQPPTHKDIDGQILDSLSEFPVFASAQSGALVTLAFPAPPSEAEGMKLQVEVSYQFAGDTVTAPPIQLPVTVGSLPPILTDSPFIYGGKIPKTEIEGHFFGRKIEQDTIIQAVSDVQRPKICYVHGIRRTGKSSLLESIEYRVEREELPVVPVAISFASIGMKRHVGLLIRDLLESVSSKVDFDIEVPTEERCVADPDRALREALGRVASQLGAKRLAIILDDLQIIEDVLAAYRSSDRVVFLGFVAFLNYVWQDARPNASVAWVLAGSRNWRQLQSSTPEVLLWNALKNVAVEFFDNETLASVITVPLKKRGIDVPAQTLEWVQRLTAGYPEVVQMVGERMFFNAIEAGRRTVTPFDAVEAARWVATTQSFETTWYPKAQLTDTQRSLMAAFVNAVPMGGGIEAFRLVRQRAVTPEIDEAISDLEYRQILTRLPEGAIKIKAHILELWLRAELAREDLGRMSGSVAIFVDIANLTRGTGSALIEIPNQGSVQVEGVLRSVEAFAASFSPAPRGPRWAVNYPPGAPAIAVCQSLNYSIKNIPESLYSKAWRDKRRAGADDIVLRDQISEVEQDWPKVNNYVVVTGDIDYSITIARLLSSGKHVQLFGWRGGTNREYETISANYPQRFQFTSIEQLLEEFQEVAR